MQIQILLAANAAANKPEDGKDAQRRSHFREDPRGQGNLRYALENTEKGRGSWIKSTAMPYKRCMQG